MSTTTKTLSHMNAQTPIIKSIASHLHKHLFKEDPKATPNFLIKACRENLIKFGLGDIEDISEEIDLPLPVLDKALPDWLREKAYKVYQPFLDLATNIYTLTPKNESLAATERAAYLDIFSGSTTPYDKVKTYELPPRSPYAGWSRFDGKKWEKIEYPTCKAMVFDFETKKQLNRKYLPFICSAIGIDGYWYSWIAPNFHKLPVVVEFGKDCELYVGHNNVSYDRRYVSECYEYASPIRMLDTYALYYAVMGMPGEQFRTYKKLKNNAARPLWCDFTSEGNLKDLAKFLLDVDISKELRQNMQALSPDELKANLDEIWEYCARDTRVTLDIFKDLYPKWRSMCPHIVSFGGMLERSTLRIGVVPDYRERLTKVDATILQVRLLRDRILSDALENGLKTELPYLLDAFKDWQDKNYLDRISRSADAIKVLSELGYKMRDTKSGMCLAYPTEQKRDIVRKHLGEINVKKIKPGTQADWLKILRKKVDEKKREVCPDNYLSISGKVTPYMLDLRWKGYPLKHNGITWGIRTDEGWIDLPHPKGSGNVGTPLSKDFKARCDAGEFTSSVVDLKALFENVSTVAAWEAFRDRFNDVYIHNDIWLTDIVPCGTITERMIGLAVVMPNTNKLRAGTECKHWFRVSHPCHIKVSADYAAQESYVFAAHTDSIHGYVGVTPLSCQTLAGSSTNGTDPHTTTSKFLVSQLNESAFKELSAEAKNGDLVQGLRPLAKNMYFANQFLCGEAKLGTMAYIALKGKLTLDQCTTLAKKTIVNSRGEQQYGDYIGGMGSDGFNRCKHLCKTDIQTSATLGREITLPLQSRYVNKDFMTTRFNFNIQQTGQELVNINLVTCRILSSTYSIPYQVSYMIHDEIHVETHKDYRDDVAWMMQIGHFFSKAMLYYNLRIANMPQNGMWFDTVEFDDRLRKSVKDDGVTPSNAQASPVGTSKDARECLPSKRILDLLF